MSAVQELEIRPMDVADVDGVMEIAASLASAPQWSRQVWMKIFELDAVLARIALVAVHREPPSMDQMPPDSLSSGVQGFAVASLLAPQADLEVIAVASRSQRQGLGHVLLSALADKLREAGITEVLLEVRASNQPAIGLYGKFGFKQSGVRERYYVDPIEDAVIMTIQP